MSVYLLDTHVLLWWFDGSKKLSKSHDRILRQASPEHPLWVSDISCWEIATLVEQQRVKLRFPLQDWLERATAEPLVRRCGISPNVAAAVASLPTTFHRDPADRILVASALVLGATLLTADERIRAAGIVPVV